MNGDKKGPVRKGTNMHLDRERRIFPKLVEKKKSSQECRSNVTVYEQRGNKTLEPLRGRLDGLPGEVILGLIEEKTGLQEHGGGVCERA